MRNVSLRQIRTILAIKRYGKISAAARHLGLTSPAVTLQVQQLEQEFGCQLFHRTRSGATPTEVGEDVIDSARRIIDELSLLEERIRAHKGVAAGTIRLGVVSTGKYFAARLIAAFNERYPGVDIMLRAANRAEIIDSLKSHEVDVALMGRPPKDIDVRSTLFGDHPLVFIARPDHPFAGSLEIGKEQLTAQRFILRENGSGTRAAFDLFMGDVPGGLAQAPMEMDSNETIKQAVMAGLGIAFISGHTIETELQTGKLVILDVEDTPIRRQWFAVSHAIRRPSPTLTAFDAFLRKEGPSLLPVIAKTYPAVRAAG